MKIKLLPLTVRKNNCQGTGANRQMNQLTRKVIGSPKKTAEVPVWRTSEPNCPCALSSAEHPISSKCIGVRIKPLPDSVRVIRITSSSRNSVSVLRRQRGASHFHWAAKQLRVRWFRSAKCIVFRNSRSKVIHILTNRTFPGQFDRGPDAWT